MDVIKQVFDNSEIIVILIQKGYQGSQLLTSNILESELFFISGVISIPLEIFGIQRILQLESKTLEKGF